MDFKAEPKHCLHEQEADYLYLLNLYIVSVTCIYKLVYQLR